MVTDTSLATVSPELYTQQLKEKAQLIRTFFQPFNIPELAVFSSASMHYRMRAEFQVWHQGEHSYYRMFDPETKKPFHVTAFPAGSKRIGELMPMLMKHITCNPLLKDRLFQIEFLTSQKNEALVTLIYHKPLNKEWELVAHDLQHQLNIVIIGRSRKQKKVLTKNFVTETLTVDGKQYNYQQMENSFTQPNAGVNEKMLSWASQCCKGASGDLLELYCGNGNFTCILAQHFSNVLATEISKTSVASARENLKANGVYNVEIVRLSSEEVTQAMNGDRVFRRLHNIHLHDYEFSTVFVDPPRAGLDKGTEALAQRFDHILYVSCNPITLKSNLATLCQTHKIERIALFDQFPYTHHAEVGVYLKRCQ
ncbi:MAG: tRNA (uridine(54)-C5)-methyltransferase TrmA [Endozoicomonas sp. (ex Botrylloides leachii)]|nr:tRNA (uridine(54)-C5)-methyltransferase TrmA [Endozoicomonas sp. (ex Botrylloides leachii)]